MGDTASGAPDEPRRALARLAAAMGLLYFGVGAWMVTLGAYLMAPASAGGLGFSAGRTAGLYSAYALAGLIAPLFVGLLADRLFRAERVVGGACLVGAATLAGAGVWCQHCHAFAGAEWLPSYAFGPLFALMAVNCLAQHVAMTVLNVVALRNLADPRRRFGLARLWGTVGWVVAGLVVGFVLTERSAGPLYLGAGAYVLCGLYAFTLPKTPPKGHGKTLAEAFGLPALALLRRREFRVLLPAAVLTSLFNQFYVLYANHYLSVTGWTSPAAWMTLGQVAEVAAMLLIRYSDPKRWAKWLMLAGLLGYAARNAALAWNEPLAVVVVGILPHGTGFAFFFVVASTTVDAKAPAGLKASAQAMLSFASGGIGSWAGNAAAAAALSAAGADWPGFWLTAAAGAAAVAALFALLYPAEDHGRR